MDVTPSTDTFEKAYVDGTPPWVIDEPQPAVVALVRAGGFTGRVLDLGCGTGEHTLHLAALGYDVLGADAAPTALARARAAAGTRGIAARFAEVDALDPAGLRDLGTFDTVLDSALFHIFDAGDRARYAEALLEVCAPGALLHLLALSTRGPGFGPEVDESDIRVAFDRPGWRVEDVATSTYRGVVGEQQSAAVGLPAGDRVDLPAWMARIRRV
ncbi:bifunctional 2-polyprenyl-6-hydroxyphenol methylase/3-demethylubiquinol 3-O-methyltransferase UbiG [Pseudonocardia sp. KRD291]|uniref:class I SAM-dependent methyltransferase n=1 Tax=Pseudonocardia sp. KRD291 TaxID=2792007 RepID=UPI001C4A4865|nr:class I SAM-dependent methyltransferase [Pseudonocardia sp. KRD291]MBW0106935.1 class I SAM-dependent methyltransferase [Pseudonocardia sp. KRD291]